jgi:hypothetical protein
VKAFHLVRPAVVPALLCLSISLPAQRADRGMIGGLVTDQTGFRVPGAAVTVRNETTGIVTSLVTNAAGAFATPPLVLGRYSVIIECAGFKAAVTAGIELQGAATIRNDVALEVGSVAESLEVKTGAEQLNVTTPDLSHTVDEKYYRDLPVVMGADVRLAESLLQTHQMRRLVRHGSCAEARVHEPRLGYEHPRGTSLHSVYGLVQLPHRTASVQWVGPRIMIIMVGAL